MVPKTGGRGDFTASANFKLTTNQHVERAGADHSIPEM
jgi:hypothetical protein